MASRSRTDLDSDDLTLRDHPYESFGQQGLALATYVPVRARPDRADDDLTREDHVMTEAERGAERVDLGEPVARRVNLGTGPKGWQRRDDRIHEDVSVRLTDDGHVDARDIEVIVHHGEVTLAGSVEDPTQRTRALRIADTVCGVVDVVDRLRVTRASG